MNRLQLQEQEVQQIHDNYARDLDRVDEIYEELADTIVIKLSQEPSAEKWAQKVTLIGEASSQQTKIIRYIFTEKENSEDINESEWKTPTGGSANSITETYEVTENKTYYFHIRDENGEIKTEKIEIKNIDKIAPQVTFEPDGETIILESGSTDISSTISVNDLGGSELDTLQYAWSQDNKKTPTEWQTFENGKTVTKDKAITINDNISVNIYGNGTITSDNSSAILSNYGTLEIENTNINLEDGGNAIYNEEGATLTVSGTSNISSNASYPTIHNSGTAEITGGTITGENSDAISNIEGATLNISETSDIIAEKTAIDNSGTVEITGGTVTNTGGGYAIYNRLGTVNITGGACSPKNYGI